MNMQEPDRERSPEDNLDGDLPSADVEHGSLEQRVAELVCEVRTLFRGGEVADRKFRQSVYQFAVEQDLLPDDAEVAEALVSPQLTVPHNWETGLAAEGLASLLAQQLQLDRHEGLHADYLTGCGEELSSSAAREDLLAFCEFLDDFRALLHRNPGQKLSGRELCDVAADYVTRNIGLDQRRRGIIFERLVEISCLELGIEENPQRDDAPVPRLSHIGEFPVDVLVRAVKHGL